jgi:hypothetical protein
MNVSKVPSPGVSRQSAGRTDRLPLEQLYSHYGQPWPGDISKHLRKAQQQEEEDFDALILDMQRQEALSGLDAESRHYDGRTELFQQLDRRVA